MEGVGEIDETAEFVDGGSGVGGGIVDDDGSGGVGSTGLLN